MRLKQRLNGVLTALKWCLKRQHWKTYRCFKKTSRGIFENVQCFFQNNGMLEKLTRKKKFMLLVENKDSNSSLRARHGSFI